MKVDNSGSSLSPDAVLLYQKLGELHPAESHLGRLLVSDLLSQQTVQHVQLLHLGRLDQPDPGVDGKVVDPLRGLPRPQQELAEY